MDLHLHLGFGEIYLDLLEIDRILIHDGRHCPQTTY